MEQEYLREQRRLIHHHQQLQLAQQRELERVPGSGNKGDVGSHPSLSREALPGDLSLESARGVQNSQERLPTHIEWDKKAHLSVLSKRVDPVLLGDT